MADELPARLEIRQTQSGFAGEAGTLLVVEPTGAWTRQNITMGKAAPVREGDSGTLTQAQLGELAGTLDGFAALPGNLGGNTRANPRKLTIQLGDKTIEMIAPAGENTGDAAPQPGPEGRAEAIARTAEKLTLGQ